MTPIDTIFYIVILIMSVVAHEVAHGFAAYKFGDMTARDQGRLTLNPIKHLDLFGSVIVPILLILSQTGLVFGWAKPVPYNPNNLRNKKIGTIVVAGAGIVTNLAIALFFSALIRVSPFLNIDSSALLSISSSIVLVNIVLALFNIIPIPPLDGSKILFELLPLRFRKVEAFLEAYSFLFVIIFIIFLWDKISPVIFWLFKLLTGII